MTVRLKPSHKKQIILSLLPSRTLVSGVKEGKVKEPQRYRFGYSCTCSYSTTQKRTSNKISNSSTDLVSFLTT